MEVAVHEDGRAVGRAVSVWTDGSIPERAVTPPGGRVSGTCPRGTRGTDHGARAALSHGVDQGHDIDRIAPASRTSPGRGRPATKVIKHR